MQGTLAPPPAYGSERGSVLLEIGTPRPSEEASRPARSSIQLNVNAHGSEDHHRLLAPSDTHAHPHPRSHPVDISLSDIAVPPPAYSSYQNSPARTSMMSDTSETALLADDSVAEGRTSYEQRTSMVEEEERAASRRGPLRRDP